MRASSSGRTAPADSRSRHAAEIDSEGWPAVARWASTAHLGELALGQHELVPLHQDLPLEHGDPLAMADRVSLGDGHRLGIGDRRGQPAPSLRVLELLSLRRELALGRRERVAHGADPELALEQCLAQAGGVGSRVALRAVAQELLQSRFQTVEHGRTRPGIDDSSGNGPATKGRGPAAGGRPKQLGNRMVGPPPETVKRAGLPALRAPG